MLPLFAQLPPLPTLPQLPQWSRFLLRRAPQRDAIPAHILRTTLPPSREMGIRRQGFAGRSTVLGMTPPPRPPESVSSVSQIDIVLDDLQQAIALSGPVAASPAPIVRDREPEGVHLRIDPQDHQRVRISGSMREVCAALDALIAVQ
jgi:hypothetical protein